MITRSVDAQDGIIVVVSIGVATRADIDTHYDELRDMIAHIRAAGDPVRVLSDQTQAMRLDDATNQYIKSQIERTFRAGDRVALLMATTNDKMYVRSILGTAEYGVFNSRIAAEMWLMEPHLQPPSG